MTAAKILGLATHRFSRCARDLLSWNECRMQLHLADALLQSGERAFMEYPYPDCRDTCDIVVTRPGNCEKATDWIELKPILPRWFYWGPAKFIGEAPFKHDIRKLAGCTAGHRWFLVVMVTDVPQIELDAPPNPRARKGLTPAQVIAVISHWAGGRPAGAKPFKAGKQFCHLVLWRVRTCCEDKIALLDGEYIVAARTTGAK